MSKFIQLAEAQAGHTTEFYFTTPSGGERKLNISVHAKCAMIRMNDKFIGSVEYNDDKMVIFGYCTIMEKKKVQFVINNTELKNSCVAPAWKQAIVDRFQKRVNDAQLDLALTLKKLSEV